MKVTVKETIPEAPDHYKIAAGEWEAHPGKWEGPGRQRRDVHGYTLKRHTPSGWQLVNVPDELWDQYCNEDKIEEEDEMTNLPAIQPEESMSIERLKTHVLMVQNVMQQVMQKDEHYGIIPGCKKPSLWKPGAEKLSLTFRLAPSYTWTETDMPNGHKNFVTKCILTHISSHEVYAEGLGSCSTMESKYRFRDEEKKCPKCGSAAIIRGKKEYGGGWICFQKKNGCGAKFSDGDQTIEGQKTGRIEYDNPADFYNTALKMAKKRAHIDATLTATAASDIFTQDIEDMVDNGTLKPTQDDGLRHAEPQANPTHDVTGKEYEATPAQKKKLFAMATEKFGSKEAGLAFITWCKGGDDHFTKSGISALFDDFDAQAALYADSQRAA
jgi:hypothetical protein